MKKPKHPIQPFLVKEGNRIRYKGTRSYCIKKANDKLKVVKNPKFAWIKEEKK